MTNNLPKDDLENESLNEESLENSSEDTKDEINKEENNLSDDSELNHEELIANLKKENEELENKYKRALADYQNLVRNSAEERKELLKYALGEFLLEILPIYDNLNTSINGLSEEQSKNPWVEGVKYIIKQFDDFFARNEVEKIKTVGEKFDYNSMEAVEGEGDYVIKEIRAGYKLKDKVIIPARIVAGDQDKK